MLKQEVVRTFRKNYPGASHRIEDWKGKTIAVFQDDLFEKVHENISEKWFYIHMKSQSEKLPRIDMLNILSSYCGYTDWQDFTYKNKINEQASHRKVTSNKVFLYVALLTLSISGLFYLVYQLTSTREYRFCFINADDLSPVSDRKVQLEIINKGESSKTYVCDSTGCVIFKTDQIYLSFVVSAPYYRQDTIERTLKKYDRQEEIKLYTDDYALMLNYFSNSSVEAWNQRRKHLDRIFAEDAVIYEVFQKGTTGIEMYDKPEFINKLSMPVKSIRNIEVLNIEYENGKIKSLRFSQ